MPEIKTVSRLLTNVSVHYRNESYVAQRLLPVLPVPSIAGEYVKYRKEDAFTIPDHRRGPKSQAREVDWASENEKYKLDPYALKDFVADRDQNTGKADGMDLEIDTTDFLTNLLMLGREKRLANILTDTSVMTNNTTLSGTSQFSDYVNSDPLPALTACRDACFVKPNTMVISEDVWAKLQFHPRIVKAIHPLGDGSGIVDLFQFGSLLNIANVYVPNGKHNIAARGKPGVYRNIWGKDIVMAYVSPAETKKAVTLGWDFTLSHGPLEDGEEMTFRVRTWRDESTGGGGTWVEADYEAEAAIVCPDVGFLIKNAVA